MTDWEITATTVYCDAVDDEVTLIVHKDGTSRCTWYQQYAGSGKNSSGYQQQRKRTGCKGADCPRVMQYRDSLAKG
jgi:hypothetical protein